MTQKANRRFGQNFLVAPGIAQRIVGLAGVGDLDWVLEIGPGRGALTDLLLQQGAQVWAVEIDPSLCAELQQRYAANPRWHLLPADFLRCDLLSILNSAPPTAEWKVVSNLPYSEGTAILRRLIDVKNRFKHLTVMLQKEVAERLLARPGNREIGFLTHLLGYHFDIRRGFHVGPGAFRPVPKVRSTVLQLWPRQHPVPLSDYPFYLKVLELAFHQRRKTLQNALAALRIEPARLAGLLAQKGLPPTSRAEALSGDDFVWLAEQLASGGA